MHGQFHPIAFMLTSNEKQIKFSLFYEALKVENYFKSQENHIEQTKKFVLKTKRGRKKNQNGRYGNAKPALARDE
jgi:hypothetical protein